MTDPLHSLKPLHGKEVKILKNDANWDMIIRITKHYNMLTVDILNIFNYITQPGTDFVTFSCHQCLKDIALNARDLANELEELANK